MLFVPPSMPTTEAQDSEIPGWIKNNIEKNEPGFLPDSINIILKTDLGLVHLHYFQARGV